MEADKTPIIPHDSSILTDGPVGLSHSQKPFPDISKHKNLVWQKFENSASLSALG